MKTHGVWVRNFRFFLIIIATIGFYSYISQASANSGSYVVKDDGESLGVISLRLYGTTKRWKDLAKLNHLKSPYRLLRGRKLSLPKRPTLSQKQGNSLILEMWRKRLARVAQENGKLLAKRQAQPKRADPYVAAIKTWKSNPRHSKKLSSAKELFIEGERLFHANQDEQALLEFTKSREADEDYVASWFFELRILTKLNRQDERLSTQEKFLEIHPEYRELPMFNKDQGSKQ